MDSRTIAACQIAAGKYAVPFATLLGVVDQESAGVIGASVHGVTEPIVRHEGHYLDKRLVGAQRDLARKEGLSSPRVGGIANPSSQEARWDKLILPSMVIDEAAEIESVSWGVGQVMGTHWQALGFVDAKHLMNQARSGVEGQVDLMMRYCQKFGLIDELQRGDFEGFARGYNGSGAVGAYSSSMRKKAIAWRKVYADTHIEHDLHEGVPVVSAADAVAAQTMLRMGVTGARVRTLQELLTRTGFIVHVDGDFGQATKEAVMGFQKNKGLKVDGLVGPETWRLLDAYRVNPSEKPGIPGPATALVVTPAGRQGAATMGGGIGLGVLGGAIQSAKTELAPVLGSSPIVDHLYTYLSVGGVAIIVLGLGWAGYGWWHANRTHGINP